MSFAVRRFQKRLVPGLGVVQSFESCSTCGMRVGQDIAKLLS